MRLEENYWIRKILTISIIERSSVGREDIKYKKQTNYQSFYTSAVLKSVGYKPKLNTYILSDYNTYD